jgi:hypothetical protein
MRDFSLNKESHIGSNKRHPIAFGHWKLGQVAEWLKIKLKDLFKSNIKVLHSIQSETFFKPLFCLFFLLPGTSTSYNKGNLFQTPLWAKDPRC